MTIQDLIEELVQRGVRIGREGRSLLFQPKSAVPPDLLDQMKARKAEILAFFDPDKVWQEVVERLEIAHPETPSEIIELLKNCRAEWAPSMGSDE
ncbi:MAG: hypothetical protein VX768_08065 [Planctomycetota bacterium]|nr:hypothetical protein [Planctomycetota bacterium]